MPFRDYSTDPAANTSLSDGTYIGPNMARNKVRRALQQLAADGRDLYDAVVAGLKGDPGGTAADIGLFTQAPSMTIDAGINMIATSGYSQVDKGGAIYVYDAAVNAAYVVANPRTSFISANGRGFRLSLEQALTPTMFGATSNDRPVGDARIAFDNFIRANGNVFARTLVVPELADSDVVAPPSGYWAVYVDAADHTLKIKGPTSPNANIFFNTDTGDTFTGSKISVPVDATLTTLAGSITFLKTGGSVLLNAQLKDGAGNVRKVAFSDLVFEATYTVRPFDVVSSPGVLLGLAPNDSLDVYGGQLESHGGSASLPMAWVATAGSPLVHDDGTGPSLSGGITIQSKVVFSGDSLIHTITYPSASPQDVVQTMHFVVDSREHPRLFSALGLRFIRADLTLTRLKVYAPYAGAKFSFLGDSLVQGRFSSGFNSGFAAQTRADYPGNVLIAGAPSSQTSDWKTTAHIRSFTDMAPQYAFIMLGTNDILNGRSLSAIETDYNSIIASLIAAGITPILCAVPPNGNSNVPTLNAWLAGRGYRFVDTYLPLLGSGVAMNAAYDSGDGIHPNDAGHSVIYTTIANYITAQGL